MKIIRTDSGNNDFLSLVQHLDAYLSMVDGAEHSFYHQYNNVDLLHHVVLVYINEEVVSCGAFKPLNSDTVEIKRMWTQPDFRGKGVAGAVLLELEQWAFELGFHFCALETGKRMSDAVSMYAKYGYVVTDNYGQYIGVENSICFRKEIK